MAKVVYVLYGYWPAGAIQKEWQSVEIPTVELIMKRTSEGDSNQVCNKQAF